MGELECYDQYLSLRVYIIASFMDPSSVCFSFILQQLRRAHDLQYYQLKQ